MAIGRKTGGRAKGTPNKKTTAVKEALQQAFEDMGGSGALASWGKENPGEFYKLWVKLLPQDINHGGQPENPLTTLMMQISGKTLKPASEVDE